MFVGVCVCPQIDKPILDICEEVENRAKPIWKNKVRGCYSNDIQTHITYHKRQCDVCKNIDKETNSLEVEKV